MERQESEADKALSKQHRRKKEKDEKKIGLTYRMYMDHALGAKPTALVGVLEGFESGGEATSMNAVRTRVWNPLEAKVCLEDGTDVLIEYDRFKSEWHRIADDAGLDICARLDGLVNEPQLNGQKVRVLRWIPEKARYTVRLVSCGRELNVRPDKCCLEVGTFVTIDPLCPARPSTDRVNPLPGVIQGEARKGTYLVDYYKPLPPKTSVMRPGHPCSYSPTRIPVPRSQAVCRLKCKANKYKPPPDWIAMHEDDGAPSELNLQMMRLQMALFEPSNLEQARAKVQDRVVNEDILEPEPQLESTIEHARRVVAADRNRDLDAALHFPQEPTSSQVATSERAREQRLTKQESKQAHQAMVGLHAGLRRAHYSVPDTHEREQMGSVLRAMETRDWSSVLLPCARCRQGLGAEHFCPVQNS
eukprot:COSAG02_NODE_13357_length_1404_cov_83.201533_1_plen_416_part_10